MIERIAYLRESLKLNQEEFAKRIGVSRNFISLVETGKRNLSDRTITDICREFNVSEVWLRTGEGEPYINLDEETEFVRICEEINLSDDSLIKRIIKSYWYMSEDEKAAFRKMIDALSQK